MSECTKRYVRLGLGDVDLGFAGREPERSPVMDAIAELEPGAPVQIETRGDRTFLLDARGRTVGRLAKRFRAPPGCRFVRGEVVAIIERRAEDSEEAYRKYQQRARWEVVVPELVFAPVDAGGPAVAVGTRRSHA